MSKLIIFILIFCSCFSAKVFAQVKTAIFAGGCFWCMEPPFDSVNGVISTIAGYTGGTKSNPTYEEVLTGTTGHREAVKVTYDSKVVTYTQLLEVFWKNIDPYDKRGQFCDKGEQYTSAVFTNDPQEKAAFEKSRPKGRRIVVTELLPESVFYPAEDNHQDYYKKNPIRYKFYRYNCGREQRLRELWGKRSRL